MDPATQELIQRTKQRRDILSQKMANMPEAAPRKRRTPVLEKEGSEKVLSESHLNKEDDGLDRPFYDSPKRQCFRRAEQNIKPDTPAIKGIQSRVQDLTYIKSPENNENDLNSTPVPVPRKSVSSPPLERAKKVSPVKQFSASTPAGSSRKGRFAALAQSINDWEDDMTHHFASKEDEKKPKWQPPKKDENKDLPSSPRKSYRPSPKNTHAPPTPRSIGSPAKVVSASNVMKNSPSKTSKVDLNSSPRPFSPGYKPDLSKSPSVIKHVSSPTMKKTVEYKETTNTPVPSKKEMESYQSEPVNAPGLNETPPKAELSKSKDEPTLKPVSERFSAWAKKAETPTIGQSEPSVRPLSAKVASFEQKISSGTPFGKTASTTMAKLNKQLCTPVDKPRPSAPVSMGKTPVSDPSELPVSQRMSQMQEKLTATPQRKDKEPTAFSVGARMSAWETMTSSNQVSNIKKVNPGEVTPVTKPKLADETPKRGFTQESLSEGVKNTVTPNKSFKDSIEERAAQMSAKRAVAASATKTSSPAKRGVAASATKNSSPTKPASIVDSPKKLIHSPSKDKNSSEDEKEPAGTNKREQQRNKARADFKNKVAELGMDCEEDRTVEKPMLVKSVTPSKSTTGSIYNIVKRKDSAQKSTPTKIKFDDSFDEIDDDDIKIPRSALRKRQESEFKKPATPKAVEEFESEQSGSDTRNSLDIDDDDISLKGFVSEAVRRESVLPSGSHQRPMSESSLDSYDEPSCSDYSNCDATSSSKAGYQAEDESMDDDDDTDRNAVDDLLDEALNEVDDDSSDEEVTMTNLQRREVEAAQYEPDMDVSGVVMRKKSGNPNAPVPKQRRSNARMLDSTDDDDDDRPYSLAAYRKSAHVQQHTMEPVVRKSKYSGKVVEEDIPMPAVRHHKDDKRVVQERVKELQELVQQEQNIIMQTSNALNKCCLGNSYFAGSAEQVECNRLLLIACQKRQAYMTEIQRLRNTCQLSSPGSGPQGSLTISDIRLPLKKDFVTKIGTSHDNMTYYFILLIRNGCQIICTQMLSSHDPMMRGSLDFPNLIKINGITGSFNITLDIYSMSILKESNTKDRKRKTPKKSKPGFTSTLESPGGPMAVRTTNFTHVTSLNINMKSLDKNSFYLERLPHLCPLYGQIFMRLKCLMESNVEERGFLTMFDDVSGFGAWHRRWCVLTGNKLCVWKYPDDETRKDPMTIIDLKRCETDKVGLIPRDICARPNTFEMVTIRQHLKGEHDTLVTRTRNTMTTVRHQMSADTKEERIMWCNKINRVLANLRTWNPDAIKPSK